MKDGDLEGLDNQGANVENAAPIQEKMIPQSQVNQ